MSTTISLTSGSSAGVEISRPKCASELERAWVPDSNDSWILGLLELNVMHDMGIVEEVMTLPGICLSPILTHTVSSKASKGNDLASANY